MPIQKFKLDNGEELKIDTSSPEFMSYENAAKQVGLVKNDAAFFFARNLEFVRQKIFKPTYAELKLLNGGLLPINTSIPEGAEEDTYDVLDSTGEADIITDFGDDIKTVEVFGNEYTNKIKSLADAYIYSVQDMRKDRMLGNVGRSVITNKALAARKAVDQKIEKMLGFGDSRYGITGMFNHAEVPSNAVAATGTGSSTLWSTKTAANILADIESAIDDIGDISEDNEAPDTMIVSSPGYRIMQKKALDTTNYSGMSILKYVEKEYGLRVVPMQQLKNGFVSGTKSGFVLYKNSEEKLEGVLPIRLMPHAPQIKNLATKNILEARCGGTRVFFPYSVSYNYGI
jgi:hypothetical protein